MAVPPTMPMTIQAYRADDYTRIVSPAPLAIPAHGATPHHADVGAVILYTEVFSKKIGGAISGIPNFLRTSSHRSNNICVHNCDSKQFHSANPAVNSARKPRNVVRVLPR